MEELAHPEDPGTAQAQAPDVSAELAFVAVGGRLAAEAVQCLGAAPAQRVADAGAAGGDRHLVFVVAPPASCLADAIAHDEDALEVRTRWIEQARAALACLYADPARCTIFDAAEVRRSPHATAALLGIPFDARRPGIDERTGVALLTPPGLPLAALAANRDPVLRALWEELGVASTPLDDHVCADREGLPDAGALLDILRAQHARQGALADALVQVDRLELQIRVEQESRQTLESAHTLTHLQAAQAQEELALLASRLAEAEAALATQRDEQQAQARLAAQSQADATQAIATARRETEQARTGQAAQVRQLIDSLSTAQSELRTARAQADRLDERCRQLEQQVADSHAAFALAQAQRADAEQRTDHLMKEQHIALTAVQEERAALRHRGDQLSAQLRDLHDEMELVRAKKADAEQRTLQLQARTQDLELESRRLGDQLHAALAGLDALAHEPPDPRRPRLQVESITIVQARDEVPHRELSFVLDGWECATGTLHGAMVRLVEHQSHPGLVVFATPDGRAPLTQWQPAGRENGRDFMILLPSDNAPQAPLMRMACVDWRLVQAMAHELARHLEGADEAAVHPRWRDIAARLGDALEALPPRLRYAASGWQPEPAGTALNLRDVMFGSRSWDELQLVWRSQRGAPQAGAFALRRCAQAPVPLASWPVDAEGRYQEHCELPLGPGVDAGVARAWLAQLPAADLALLTSLLDALPGLASLPELPGGLAADARAVQRGTRQALKGLQLRRVARRALGALRHRA